MRRDDHQEMRAGRKTIRQSPRHIKCRYAIKSTAEDSIPSDGGNIPQPERWLTDNKNMDDTKFDLLIFALTILVGAIVGIIAGWLGRLMWMAGNP